MQGRGGVKEGKGRGRRGEGKERRGDERERERRTGEGKEEGYSTESNDKFGIEYKKV